MTKTANNEHIAAAKPMKIKVNENFCFKGLDFTVQEMQEALNAYHKQQRSHSDWLYNDDIAIFVDANVLLNIYFAPVPLRVHLAKFLQDNKDRLFLVNQVETEFMRHRLEFIDKYKNTLTTAASKFRNAFKSFEVDFCSRFKELKNASVDANFVDSLPQTDALIEEAEKMAFNDQLLSEKYADFQNKLKGIKEKFEEEYHQLFEKIDIEYRDPVLSAISNINILPPLSQGEYDLTKNLYEQLKERFKQDSDSSAAYLRFPGSGEKKNPEEKEEPWGDLVIYHQILVYMAGNKKDAIFLTYDNSKNDWVKSKKGEPYSYYIADAYKNTKQTLFIIPAGEFLPKNYKSIEDIRMDEDSVGDNAHNESVNDIFGGPSTEITDFFQYKEITEEEFLDELKKYSLWAENFGEKYVSKSYFIHVVLGHQQYRFSKSFDMLYKLCDEGKVEIYDNKREGYVIPSIKMTLLDEHKETDSDVIVENKEKTHNE